MNIENYIKVYDNFLKPEAVSSLLIWLSKQHFETAKVVGADTQLIKKEIRKTQTLSFNITRQSSQTLIHWHNYLCSRILEFVRIYEKETTPFDGAGVKGINDLSALKYEETGFYKFHTDHHFNFPRTLTAIILLNNDYKGGELEFGYSHNHESFLKIEPKVGRLILWPSNFLFPHRVNPVSEGIRYSLVSWMF
tara:strand:- start:2033 stop:2611 length:579 start_codon:yes stop_codon:yes gene_type:complete